MLLFIQHKLSHVFFQTYKTWEKLGIDFIGPLPMTPLENSMILTLTDLFSKQTEAFALPDKTETSAAASLVELFCNKLIPMAVLSDNGSEFCNEVWILQLHQIRLVRILQSLFLTNYYKRKNTIIHRKILAKIFLTNVFGLIHSLYAKNQNLGSFSKS